MRIVGIISKRSSMRIARKFARIIRMRINLTKIAGTIARRRM